LPFIGYRRPARTVVHPVCAGQFPAWLPAGTMAVEGPVPMNENRKKIGEQYRQVAKQGGLTPASQEDIAQAARLRGYLSDQIEGVPEEAVQMGLGCGNPVAIAELQPGQVVLDLGSGGGLDVFLAARKVGPTGKAVGVDLTAEMVERARRFATEGGYQNVEFHVGQIESLPVVSESIDVVISNCVINHSSDKAAVFREAHRVLKPGGRLHVSDLVVVAPPSELDGPGMEIWTDWLKVACDKGEYLEAMEQAGFADVAVVVGQP
jgi:arsenite methyltransferase